MVNTWWKNTFEKYDHISIGEYIIMTNHMHGIIIVGAGSPRPGSPHPNDKISSNIDNHNDTGRGNNGRDNYCGRGDPAPTLG
jgi:hypothetical protein